MALRKVGSQIAGALAQGPKGGMQRVSPGVYRAPNGSLVRGNNPAPQAVRQPSRNVQQPQVPQQLQPYQPGPQGQFGGMARGIGAAFGSNQIQYDYNRMPSDKMYRFPQNGNGQAEAAGQAAAQLAQQGPGGFAAPWQSGGYAQPQEVGYGQAQGQMQPNYNSPWMQQQAGMQQGMQQGMQKQQQDMNQQYMPAVQPMVKLY